MIQYKSLPGLFSADTSIEDNPDGSKDVPKGKIHIHCVVFETYELNNDADLDISFTILAALVTKEAKLYNKALQLKEHLEQI